MDTETINRLLLYVSAAVGYAVAGYMAKVKKHPEVTFDPTRFGTTVLLGVLAGLIMAASGDDTSQEAYAAAMAIAIPIFDKAVNFVQDARRDDAEPTEPTNDAESTAPTTDSETTKYR